MGLRHPHNLQDRYQYQNHIKKSQMKILKFKCSDIDPNCILNSGFLLSLKEEFILILSIWSDK